MTLMVSERHGDHPPDFAQVRKSKGCRSETAIVVATFRCGDRFSPGPT